MELNIWIPTNKPDALLIRNDLNSVERFLMNEMPEDVFRLRNYAEAEHCHGYAIYAEEGTEIVSPTDGELSFVSGEEEYDHHFNGTPETDRWHRQNIIAIQTEHVWIAVLHVLPNEDLPKQIEKGQPIGSLVGTPKVDDHVHIFANSENPFGAITTATYQNPLREE